MKMYYGNVPVNSIKIKHYEMNTNDATMVASDLQSGVTCYARGQKVVGTGKSFEFAYYGNFMSNESLIIPINTINVIHISSLDYPTHSIVHLGNMRNLDFTNGLVVCNLIVDGEEYPVTVTVNNNEIFISCNINVYFEVFFGKDNYV